VEARLFGATTLAQPILMWPFLALPILLLVYFGVDRFGANFTKIIFSFVFFFFQFFLINKNYFFRIFSFFSKAVEDILFIFNKFLSTLHKKYKFKHTTTVFYFLFDYSSNR